MKNFESPDKPKYKLVNVKLPNGHLVNNKTNNVCSDECASNNSNLNNSLEVKSVSLPDCTNKDDLSLNLSLEEDYKCEGDTPSPKSESWLKSFRTWPERYEKLKNVDATPKNTQEISNCDNSNNSVVKNKLSFSEALQNISLAYSPITKQLHIVDTTKTESKDNEDSSNNDNIKKRGHKRNEAGSFSSTNSNVSCLSDQSTSGSLIGSEEKLLSSLDISILKTRRRSLTNFFSKHLFTWKGSSTESPPNSNIWKIFNKQLNDNVSASPIHVVASSSALIQHERPSSLPAKPQKEEERHKNEYKAILAAAKKKDEETSAAKQKKYKLQLKLEEQQAAATKHFTQHVLPNWNKMRYNKKTLDLWWQGLPSSIRGKVWTLAIGNDLNLTPQLYEICLNRAQSRLYSPDLLESDANQESSIDVIQLDISRTFPHLGIFQDGGPYSETLHSLLAAYASYRPDVGYVQGMSYIAAILILNMEPCDAFICFSNLLNQPLHLSAFTLNQTCMQYYYNAYDQIFSYNLPKLHGHFEKSGLTPDLYLLEWIYTIFAKAMPLDVACRVWDVFLRDGYEFIFKTALGILHLHQDILLTMDFLQGAQFLTHLPDDISGDMLFRSIQLVNTMIGKQTFTQIVEQCKYS